MSVLQPRRARIRHPLARVPSLGLQGTGRPRAAPRRPAVIATSDTYACLGESDVLELVRCVRLNLDCADVCDATAGVVTRQTEPDLGVVRAAAFADGAGTALG